MDPLINLDSYKEFKQICEKFDKEMDDILNEVNFGAMIGSPIKYTKIRNNSKKLQKALVQAALNDVDYEKKKEKGSFDKLDSKQKATLAAANKAKNKALADKSAGVQSRMSDLATTDGLKQVAKIAKSKATNPDNALILRAVPIAASPVTTKNVTTKTDTAAFIALAIRYSPYRNDVYILFCYYHII